MSNFLVKALYYSFKLWVILCIMLVLVGLQITIFIDLIRFYSSRPVTQSNLFALSLLLNFAIIWAVTKLGSRLGLKQDLRFEMNQEQWEKASEIIIWFKKHEDLSVFLLMIILPFFFSPSFILLKWIALTGIPPSLAFIFSFIPSIFFFIFISVIGTVFYESVIRPIRPSISQIEKIINGLYKGWNGEKLEKAKRTLIRIPARRIKKLAAGILLIWISTLTVAQVVELLSLTQESVIIRILTLIQIALVPALILIQHIGKDKTKLDLLFERYKKKGRGEELMR